MTKWIKFYYTDLGVVKTLHLESDTFQDDGQTFAFTDKDDMLSKSTVETLNFWDGQFVGRGHVSA